MRRVFSIWFLLVGLVGHAGAVFCGPAPVPAPIPTRQIMERTSSLARAATTSVQAARLGGEKAPPSLDALVVFCEFTDQVFYGNEEPGTPVDEDFAEIHYSARDSVYFDHHLRDVREYFATASGGAFHLDFTIHSRVVVLPREMGWYGHHPEEGEQPVLLAKDVLEAIGAQPDAPVFGPERTVFLIHAGSGEETNSGANPEQISSTYLDRESFAEAQEAGIIEEAWLPVDGGANQVDQVLVLPETAFQDGGATWGSLGIYCYLVGQRLGMLPLGVGERSWGIGSLGLMGWGLYGAGGWNPPLPCPYNKWLMGWIDPAVHQPGAAATVTLTPARDAAATTSCAKVEIGAGEYWLLEYRRQDPDGNRRWTFADDLNRNGRRDYLNMSEADSLPVDGEKFDPDEDEREWLTGAEWDFNMTYNGRDGEGPEDTGRGSGVYIWHVDEGVIQAWLAAGTRLVNWDPAHKGVDVEEADGIQDMDSYRSDLVYAFGHENDTYQGAAFFTPESHPRTDTATGAPTGVWMQSFSNVVVDSQSYALAEPAPDGGIWGYEYASEMTFTLSREDPGGSPVLAAERELPAGVDLSGSHVLLADLDPVPDGRAEIVLAGHAGEIFVLDGQLNEFLDDGTPADLGPFAVGTYADQPVAWNLPAAVGDLDWDQSPDVVLTAPSGLYGFAADGTPLRDVLPDAHGLYYELADCAVPPILVPVDADVEYDPAGRVYAAVIVRENGTTRLRFLGGDPVNVALDLNLGDVVVRAAPTRAFGRIWVAAADTAAGGHRLLACDPDPAATEPVLAYDLVGEPGFLVPAWGYETGTGDDRRRWIAVVGIDGTGETVMLDADLERTGSNFVWSDGIVVRSGMGLGGFTGEDLFGRVSAAGDWMEGWPRRPQPGFSTPDSVAAAGPLVATLSGASRPADQLIFTASDGRIFAYGPRGEAEPGWPLAGPGYAAGTPALGNVDQDLQDDLVSIGTFARIGGVDADSGELDTTVRSVVAVWQDVAVSGGAWTMWGGTPWRDGTWDAEGDSGPIAGAQGTGIISGSHICYPSPLTDATLQVRARLRGAGRVRVHIYNLEGERITTTSWRDVPAQDAFDVPVTLDRVVSGMYLCRLEAQSDGGATDHSVVTFAVSR